MVARYFTIQSKGNANIRLGEFKYLDGRVFKTADSGDGNLTAAVLSGNAWVDSPGTYSAIDLVVSKRIHDLMPLFSLCQSFAWKQTEVQGLAKSENIFFVLRTELHVTHDFLASSNPSVIYPDYKIRKSMLDIPLDLFMDTSFTLIFSERLVLAIRKLNPIGIAFIELPSF